MMSAFLALQIVSLTILLGLELIIARATRQPPCLAAMIELLVAGAIATSSLFLLGYLRSPWTRGTALVLVLLEVLVLLYVPRTLRVRQREALELTDPARTVADARELIRSSKDEELIKPEDLPPSLRIPRVFLAQAHGDHLDLINYRDPDGHAGFRIWSEDATRPRDERPTEYPDIFIYWWNNDRDVAPDNMP